MGRMHLEGRLSVSSTASIRSVYFEWLGRSIELHTSSQYLSHLHFWFSLHPPNIFKHCHISALPDGGGDIGCWLNKNTQFVSFIFTGYNVLSISVRTDTTEYHSSVQGSERDYYVPTLARLGRIGDEPKPVVLDLASAKDFKLFVLAQLPGANIKVSRDYLMFNDLSDFVISFEDETAESDTPYESFLEDGQYKLIRTVDMLWSLTDFNQKKSFSLVVKKPEDTQVKHDLMIMDRLRFMALEINWLTTVYTTSKPACCFPLRLVQPLTLKLGTCIRLRLVSIHLSLRRIKKTF